MGKHLLNYHANNSQIKTLSNITNQDPPSFKDQNSEK